MQVKPSDKPSDKPIEKPIEKSEKPSNGPDECMRIRASIDKNNRKIARQLLEQASLLQKMSDLEGRMATLARQRADFLLSELR